MIDYCLKAEQRYREYRDDCRRQHPPYYAYLETYVELENKLHELLHKTDTVPREYSEYQEQRRKLEIMFFSELLYVNGFRYGDGGLWVTKEEIKKEPEGC